MVRDNSLKAYLEEKKKLGKRTEEILKYLRNHEGQTSREIMEGMGFLETNTVRPRLTELIKSGKIFEGGKKKDKITGKTVTTYYLKC